jgi:hypothetical protein
VGCEGTIPWIVGIVDVMWGYFTNLIICGIIGLVEDFLKN